MPDYNRAAAAYWWLAVLGGAALLLVCLASVAARPWTVALQVALGTALAMIAGLFPMRIPRTRNSFVAGEIFIFLLLLLHGPAAAAVAAAGEAAVGAWRSSQRWTSRLASPAMATLAMFATGWLFELGRDALAAAGLDGPAGLLALAMAVALVYFFISTALVSGVARLNRGEALFQPADAISVFRWVGMAYAGSAAMAVLLYVTSRQAGPGVLLVMVPLLALLLLTLHLYFRQQEAAEAMRRAGAEAAAREAALIARQAETAERHLHELQASERRFHSAFTHASIGMALLAFDGRILQANPALGALLGGAEADLLGRAFQDLVCDDEARAALRERLGRAGSRDLEPFATELRCLRSDGNDTWAAVHCSFFTEAEADSPCLILQAQDIDARRRAEAGLEHLAYHDALTGLPNRRRFMECLAGSIARCQSDPTHSFAVLFVDFDRFKLVNDSLGHNAGDQLLVQLARRLQERLRPTDIVARLGGDEFALLAERIEQPRDATVLAERLLGSLARSFDVAGTELTASASIGITFSHQGARSAEEVLRDADTAMYKAKREGKARYEVFDASLHTEVSRRLRLEGELRRAIDARQLVLVYQPVFDLGGGAPRGFEALLRWNHPAEGLLGPHAFLSIAEESGLMRAVSDFVLHGACRQLREWQRADPAWSELTVSVNVSADEIAQPGFVSRVARAVIESGLRPQHLTLELTENVLTARPEHVIATLTELRRLGVHVAVDDFGTGYSSLSQLSRLPIDSLKIDRSFVGHLRRGSDEMAVVRAIIQLGQSLRKSIVAEGIESAGQSELLREMGCGLGQGHHLCAPMSAQAAGEMLRRLGAGPLH